MMTSLKSIEEIGLNFTRLIVPYSVLLVLSGGDLSLENTKESMVKFVRSGITDEFIGLISRVDT